MNNCQLTNFVAAPTAASIISNDPFGDMCFNIFGNYSELMECLFFIDIESVFKIFRILSKIIIIRVL